MSSYEVETFPGILCFNYLKHTSKTDSEEL